jgi:hypothetical protein
MRSVTIDGAVLHALRVCGFADTGRLADQVSLPADQIEESLQTCEREGLVRHRAGRVSGWLLTDAGRQRHADQVVGELPVGEPERFVNKGYESFLELNRELKHICTAWQLRTQPDGSTTVNDHGDQSYDDEVIGRLAAHHRRCDAMFESLAMGLARLDGYRHRLGDALERLTAGDTAAFATPMSASYHCVWMELHQDLLITLGRERDEADGH